MKIFIKILFLCISFNLTYAQSPTCATASAMCTGQGGPYNNTNTGTVGGNQTGYGQITNCNPNPLNTFPTLFSTPRPAWFYYTIGQTGPINLSLQQFNAANVGIDVDFALWGPFQNLNNICNQLNTANEVDCSYSPLSTETVTIPNSNAGDLYVIVIDNYSGQAGNISVTQTGGSGSTNCDFLSSVSLNNTDGSPLTNLDYCKPETKEMVATIDISDFPGVPSNLRFNYTWFKNNIQITTISNSISSTNNLIVSESGIYKVAITAYDITVNPTGATTGLQLSEAEADIKFHTKPDVGISNSNTVCLNTNPELTATIINTTD